MKGATGFVVGMEPESTVAVKELVDKLMEKLSIEDIIAISEGSGKEFPFSFSLWDAIAKEAKKRIKS